MSSVSKEDLILSIEKRLQQQENSLRTSIQYNKEYLSNEKKVGFLERKQKESIIRSKQKQLKEIDEIIRKFASLTNDLNLNIKNISNEMLKEINNIIGSFSNEERIEVEKSINSDVKEANKETINKAEQKVKEVTKSVKGLNIKNKNMDIYDSETRKIRRTEPRRNMENSMEMIEVLEVQDLESEIKHITIQKNEMYIEESHLFENLEEMIKKGKIEKEPKTEKLLQDFDNIKESIINQKKLEEQIRQVKELLYALQKESDISFAKTNGVINKIVDTKKKEIEEYEKITNGIDLEYLKEKVNKYLDEKRERQESGEEKVYENIPQNRTPEEEARLLTEEYEFVKEQNGTAVYAFYTEYMNYKQQNPKAEATYLDFMKVRHPSNTEIIHLLEIKEKRDKTIYAEYLKAKANGEKRSFSEFAEKKFDITKDMDSVDIPSQEKQKEEGMSR